MHEHKESFKQYIYRIKSYSTIKTTEDFCDISVGTRFIIT